MTMMMMMTTKLMLIMMMTITMMVALQTMVQHCPRMRMMTTSRLGL